MHHILLSIQVCIFCLVHDLGALGVVQKIQIMTSLQVNELFTVDL